MIRFGRDVCANVEEALTREWLETNGIGGYASSTIVGLNTRRYHGLLIAAIHPPVGRMVLLSKLEETLIVGRRRVELSSNRYSGAIHPHGFRWLTEFRLDPFPIFTYDVEGLMLEKTVCLLHGENTTLIQYELKHRDHEPPAGIDLRLELRPLLAFRDHHALTHENHAIDSRVDAHGMSVMFRPYLGLPPLYISHAGGQVEVSGHWYRPFEYDVERARGLDFIEDLFNPCVLTFDLNSESGVLIAASTGPLQRERVEQSRQSEAHRRRSIVAVSPSSDEFTRALVVAADQFIVNRGAGQTIIAGYHWFSDWGRDTMIALPGLSLVTGRVDVARRILLEYVQHVTCGMVPNRFPDGNEAPAYTSVDATLWFLYAVQMFIDHTRDDSFVRRHLYDVLNEIVDWHLRGTRFGIRVDEDGLLMAGPAEHPLTWMDAKIGDWIVTPRFGKPVEVQALWYNALRLMEVLAKRFGDEPLRTRYAGLAGRARRSFNRQFWSPAGGYLYDVIDGSNHDDSMRPNQLLALSLPFSMLSPTRAVSVLDVVKRSLLTPYGLRTLAATDSRYRGRYEGDQRQRDAAYHQGTVWPWLMGPFITAYLRVHRTTQARAEAAEWLQPLHNHLTEAGLGQVSEVFDGDAPHRPSGCIAQAWSVAELLRIGLVTRGPRSN